MNTNTIATEMNSISSVNEDTKFDFEAVLIKREDHLIEENNSLQDCTYTQFNCQNAMNSNFQEPNEIFIKQEDDVTQAKVDVVTVKNEIKSEVGWCHPNEVQETNELTHELDMKHPSFERLEPDEFECKDFSLDENNVGEVKCEVIEITSDEENSATQSNEGSDGMSECGLCDCKTKHRHSLRQPVTVKQENFEMSKSQCSSRRTKSRKHSEKCAVLKCEFGEYKKIPKNNLTQHMKTKHDDVCEIFKCFSCEFTTKFKHSLIQHVAIKHDINSKTYKCEFCEYSTRNKHYFKTHNKMIHDDSCEKLNCGFCEYTTKWKSYLRKHIRLKHDENCERFKCQMCEYSTTRENNFKKHVKVKHEYENCEKLKCGSCEYSAKTKDALNKHFKTKHDENCDEFECEHYKLWHDGNCKVWECQLCNYATKRKDNFKRHMRVTHDENCKLWKCELCEFSTKWQIIFKRHFKVKHDDNCEILRCKLCEFSTKWRGYLTKHIKRKHSVNGAVACETKKSSTQK